MDAPDIKVTLFDLFRLRFYNGFVIDATGTRYDDVLSTFVKWYGKNAPAIPMVPLRDGQHFVEGVTGVTLYRTGNFQVQLFIADPNTVIHPHHHPDVDSYELSINGMAFRTRGKDILDLKGALEINANGIPVTRGVLVRVKPNDVHSALASPEGGVFLSIQHWLNGIPPSSVGNNWSGDNMGHMHDQQIIHTEKD